MLMTLGQLRGLILGEMKLGVAGAHAAGEAWGNKDEPEKEDWDGTYIAMPEPENFEPDPAIMALYRKRGAYDMAGDEIDDELEDRYADAAVDATVPSRPIGPEPERGASTRMTTPAKTRAR